ncbi:amylo-alpha-1,6-glucosidase [Halostella pelagica]|uniref:amylo-alpha-1,6-glucosidase n=1 Tax=Halostella pelagica TaxID=2583824 RepID=UPI00107FE68B|nr:glycogen debranching N-terminal domain-containing protein [Halostella pelagica]
MNTLVDGVTYLVADDRSDAGGLYHGDTRYLLPLAVDVAGIDLTLVSDDRRPPTRRTRRYASVGTTVNEISDTVTTKHATVALTRRQTVTEGAVVEQFDLHNHFPEERTFEVTVRFDADFTDIFEVRGIHEATDRAVSTTVDDRTVTFASDQADGNGGTTPLETTVTFDAEPTRLDHCTATFSPTLSPQERWRTTVEVVPRGESTVRATPSPAGDGAAESGEGAVGETSNVDSDGPLSETSNGDAHRERVAADEGRPETPGTRRDGPFILDGPIRTGNAEYDRIFRQARRDVSALTTVTDQGPVPLAGAPWFVTVFGRDSLLSSYSLLPVAPALARGTVRYLAARQGTCTDERRDESPGKILHEIRRGELARTGAIPQTPYYGSVDATPLWAVLLHETWRWTGDDELVTDLWGALDAALDWIERQVEAVGDNPFLYYRELGLGGVVHKVWRDSANGVQHTDGTQASPPLASAAVQGYVYDALTRAAELASVVRGDDELASDLTARAAALAARFDEAFWMPDREFYAAALTADGRQVDTVVSTVGHCLWSGIVPDRRGDAVADRLLDPALFSGWGLRTLSADDDGYSPVSYHAGGVWPHDNALVALGLARYERHDAAETVAAAQLDALSRIDGESAPELFCGFDGVVDPVPYPSACRPQAWAAAAPFAFLRAVFDLGPGPFDPCSVREPDAFSSNAAVPVVDAWE